MRFSFQSAILHCNASSEIGRVNGSLGSIGIGARVDKYTVATEINDIIAKYYINSTILF